MCFIRRKGENNKKLIFVHSISNLPHVNIRLKAKKKKKIEPWSHSKTLLRSHKYLGWKYWSDLCFFLYSTPLFITKGTSTHFLYISGSIVNCSTFLSIYLVHNKLCKKGQYLYSILDCHPDCKVVLTFRKTNLAAYCLDKLMDGKINRRYEDPHLWGGDAIYNPRPTPLKIY